MYNRFSKKVLANSDVIINMWMEEIQALKEKKYAYSISDELFEETNREFVEVIFSSIKNNGSVANFEEFAEKLISLGWPLSYITDGLQDFRRVTINYVLSETDKIDTDYFSNILKYADDWVEPIIHQLVNEYSGRWENIVSFQ